MVGPEARNDRTNYKTQVLGPVQESGPQLLSAQAGAVVLQSSW